MYVNTQGTTRGVGATSLTQIRNIIKVTQKGPLIGPVIRNIKDEWSFGDLIMRIFVSVEDQQLEHFRLTPFHVIASG